MTLRETGISLSVSDYFRQRFAILARDGLVLVVKHEFSPAHTGFDKLPKSLISDQYGKRLTTITMPEA
jgi:hypothetical protein